MSHYFSQFQLDSANRIIPVEIKQWCMDNYKYFYVIYLNDTCALKIATKTKKVPNVYDYVTIIHCMIHAFSIPQKKRLIICLLPTHFKKKWNKKQTLTHTHVNSGFTSFKDYSTEIIIFRQEEIHKVLFHELIHALQLHCVYGSTFDTTDDDMYHADESIVETWATILFGLYAKHRKS